MSLERPPRPAAPPTACKAAHHQVRRRPGAGQGLRGDRQGRGIPSPASRRASRCSSRRCRPCASTSRCCPRRRADRDARTRRGRLQGGRGARHRHQQAGAGLRRRGRASSRGASGDHARRQQLQSAPDRPGHRRRHPHVVQRRGRSGDHQLPHAQAGEGRPLLREDLRSHQGLGVLLRQVQACPVQGHHLRALRRRGVTRSSPARERMGHIELAAPVVHIWYLRGAARGWPTCSGHGDP